MGGFLSRTRTCPSQAEDIHTAKNQPWGSASFFNQHCTYKDKYTRAVKNITRLIARFQFLVCITLSLISHYMRSYIG